MKTAELLKSINQTNKRLDTCTLCLFLVVVLSQVIVGYLLFLHHLNFWTALILSTTLMHFSFTFWHEAAHRNLSRNKAVNNIVGFFASVVSVYPGYFVRKKEHLVHHKYEGEAAFDPVYPRIQKVNIFNFLPKVLYSNNVNSSLEIKKMCKLNGNEVFFEGLHYCILLTFVVLMAFLKRFDIIFSTILVPRAIVFVLHAYLICYFPHKSNRSGYVKYRIFNFNSVISFFFLNQNYHGVHHLFPQVRWHRYKKFYNQLDAEDKNKIQIVR